MLKFKKTSYLMIYILFLIKLTYGNDVNLPDGFVIGDNEGITLSTDGRYFIFAENLHPGDRIQKNVMLKNNRQDTSFKLYLSTRNINQEGNIDMNNRILTKISIDNIEIFSGRPDGVGKGDFSHINMKDDPLFLGNFTPSQIRNMKINYIFEGEDLNLGDTGSISFGWMFRAYATEYALPETGAYFYRNKLR